MEEQLVTTPTELKSMINSYRRRMAGDRELYLYYEEKYRTWHPEAWRETSHLLVVRSRFWRGEILRAKHNLARYMRGEPLITQRKFVIPQSKAGDWGTHDLLETENALAAVLEDRQPAVLGQLDDQYYKMCVRNLRSTADYIERYTYGG
jgi:hypothetical protein